jgi:hypothetical protein
MRIASKRASAAWIPFLASAMFGAGCFKPKVQDNGFLCADAGASDAGTCPEGFHCAPTGLCKEGPLPEMCTAAKPRVTEICEPDPGHDCDPICQSRCECGRCTLVGNQKLDCTPLGNSPNKDRGDFCNFANDDCKPGNICLRDCSNKVARCFQFCATDSTTRDDICQGQCNFSIDDANGPTGFKACDPPVVDCNPVGTTNSDCNDPALYCYVLSNGLTACDCKGTIPAGGTGCGVYNSCVQGYSCVILNNTATCLKTCRMGGTDCAPGVCTQAGPGNFGYCPS